jgi:uncharacterized membrane protein
MTPSRTSPGHDPVVPQTKEEIDERRMELMVGYLLLTGVIVSQAALLLGLILDYVEHGTVRLAYLIKGMNYFQFLIHDILALGGPHAWGARTFVNLGIALLMFTPFIRVVASVFFFALEERNLKYTLFTFFVAAVLTYSLFLR